MTAKQRERFYFPAWSQAAKARGWTKGVMDSAPMPTSSPAVNEILNDLYDFAEVTARAEHREIKPDDFRHACHFVALGRDMSCTDLTNDECEKVVALFRILADPDDLRAQMAWNSPKDARRRRMLWWIRHHCVESYVVEVCRNRFGHDEPANLTYDQLLQLHMTLKNRPAALRN